MDSTRTLLNFHVSNFNIVAACLGGFLSLFGLVSYLLKERFYLSETLVSMFAGIILGPPASNLIKPIEYAQGSERNLESVTLYFSRLVLGVQLVLAGIQLPSRYLKTEWKSLAYLLGPGMCIMWVVTSLLAWALIPNISFLFALALAASVTPTDPVLSNSIVKGKFADKNILPKLQKIIIAESGANDGLGYPFLFLPLYLIRYVNQGGIGQGGNGGTAIGYWFGITWGYTIIMSVLYGIVVGYIFRVALRWAEDRKYVDRESFLIFAITIALFIVGTLGMIGSDDVLACFIAGNVFTWDDWFRQETEDDSFQPTIDLLFNVAIFAWYGAICPWSSFLHNDVLPLGRMIALAILILLLRRLPMVYALHKGIHQIEDLRQLFFIGYFGPIGVSAIFYLYTTREFLELVTVDGVQRSDAAHLSEVMNIFVWFMVVCSVLVFGLSIPVGKLGIHIPRTISRSSTMSRAFNQGRNDEGESVGIFHRAMSRARRSQQEVGSAISTTSTSNGDPAASAASRQGTSAEDRAEMGIMQTPSSGFGRNRKKNVRGKEISAPQSGRKIGGSVMHDSDEQGFNSRDGSGLAAAATTPPSSALPGNEDRTSTRSSPGDISTGLDKNVEDGKDVAAAREDSSLATGSLQQSRAIRFGDESR